MLESYNSPHIYDQAAISTLTVGGLDTILKLSGAHPERIILQGEKVGVNTFQLVPLRGMSIENMRQSGIIKDIITAEAPWPGITGRILCGPGRAAENLIDKVLEDNPSIISIDFIDGKSAIEIASIEVNLMNQHTRSKKSYERKILPYKRMIFDTFHARDLTPLGRKSVMKGMLPNKQEVEDVYTYIFDQEPVIVGIHIQERNPQAIQDFINKKPTLLEFEIKQLKELMGTQYNKIPLIIELDPLPTSPLGMFNDISGKGEAYKQKNHVIKAFVARVNELRYG